MRFSDTCFLSCIRHQGGRQRQRAFLGDALWILLCTCWSPDASAQVSAEGVVEPTRILFVFDASNSMNAFWGGQRKMATATALLSESLGALHQSESLELGLRVYGHGTKHVTGQQDCDDTELMVPFSSYNNLIIKQQLSRIRAQGTTPIARSLEQAAYDFPDKPGRNVIVLITDGLEACDEDPCAVSRALQDKGIVVKPFVIGMGIEDKWAASLQCIGNFYDATDPEAFEHVLQLVLEQALHNTTVHLELLDDTGQPLVTNYPYSFTDTRTEEHSPQYVHTMPWSGQADTLYVDPIPTYNVTIHSLPLATLKSVVLSPGVHNVVTVPDMASGHLTPQFARGVRTDYGALGVAWHSSGACEALYQGRLGEKVRLRTGAYDVHFGTTPKVVVEHVEVGPLDDLTVEIPSPGSLVVSCPTAGYAVLLDAVTLETILQFEEGDVSGRYTLQPGNYTLLFRARNARGTLYSIKESFQVTSGSTTNLKLHG